MKKVQIDSNLNSVDFCVTWVRNVSFTAVTRLLRMIHQPHVRGLQASSAGVAVVLVFTMLTPAVRAATTPSAAGASGYEIPLGELNKVKKERPQKRKSREHKKNKGESAAQPATDAAAPAEKADLAPAAADKVIAPDTRQPAVSEKTVPAASVKAEPHQAPLPSIVIHHDPYSYVIAGKRTTIQAVVSSAESIQAVYARFRSAENGSYARVPMRLVSGTQFTYTAILPALAASGTSLRYTVVAVDSSGLENSSKEFVIAVKPSTVLPGWQLEKSADTIKIRLENREKPLEGFADPGIVE